MAVCLFGADHLIYGGDIIIDVTSEKFIFVVPPSVVMSSVPLYT